jgi:hypothetical protein
VGGDFQLRIARPTRDLDAAVSFYRLLGLPVVACFEDHDGYSGVVLGLPDAALIQAAGFEPGPAAKPYCAERSRELCRPGWLLARALSGVLDDRAMISVARAGTAPRRRASWLNG